MYRVHYNGPKKFDSLEEATKFCSKIFDKTGIVLGITTVTSKISEQYKNKLVQFLIENGPTTTPKLREKFPRAPLREMEKEEGRIMYQNDKWMVTDHWKNHS